MEVSGTTNSTPTENVSVEVHLGALCQTLSDSVRPMLGRFGPMLGSCWAHVGSFGGLAGPGQFITTV